ncbi:S8 family serine peptidase [Paenibacillus piscarius]|uniref:S8 family serine peptidase n=1 Tax=Paenibacillus piscarius TaxID=1089681 RepID=UPI002377D559|nr:S8 family serine peptidase [Paenibacillus piscarius]
MIPGAASAASSLKTPVAGKQLPTLIQANQPYISPQINTKSSNQVRVIVQLSSQPAAVGKYAARQGISALARTATEAAVKSQQTDVLDQAEAKGIDLSVNYKYDTVLNGFEVTVPADKIPDLAKIPGVTSIYPNSTWYALPDETVTEATYRNDNAPLKQIRANWAADHGLTGKGLKVGVIDTGVDYTHPDIADAYKGGYDSFYQDNDPYEEVPLTPEKDPYGVGYEGTSHGTHVSGTIIGQYAAKGDVAQKGVAPGAKLYVYKVLGRNLENPSRASGSSAQVIDGIEHAVKDGMDVINLSLGSDSEKDVNSPDVIAINNAVLSGVTAVIANGNNGEAGYFSMGSPAASQLGISVGAVDSPIKAFSGEFRAEIPNSVTSVTYDTYQPFHVMAYELGKSDFASIFGTGPVKVAYAKLGKPEDYPEGDLSDTIVLVSRGDLTFDVKIANAKARNVKALAIFNGNAKEIDGKIVPDLSDSIKDRDGFIGSNFGDGYQNVPTLDIQGMFGRQLARAIDATADKTATFTFGSDYPVEMTLGDEVTYFSSAGPNFDGKLSIKPDIVAPGYGVLSTYPAYGKDHPETDYSKAYARSSGTSMATPHVAGLALLIKEAHPTYTPLDIRAALANTADPVFYQGAPEDLYLQGPGRANVENAIITPALLQSIEPITILDKNFVPQNVINYNPSTSFGTLLPGSEASQVLQLKNMSDSTLTYSASVELNSGDPDQVSVTLDKSSVTAAAKGASTFNLKVNVAGDTEPQSLQGNVVLKADGQPTLHLPFAISVDKTTEQPSWGTGIQEATLSQPIVYTNSGAVLNYKLKAKDINYYEVNLVGLDDIKKGSFQVSTTGAPDKFFEPGNYSTVISSTYHPYDHNGDPILDASGNPAVASLTDGVYKLEILGIKAKDNTKTPIKIDYYKDEYYSAYTSFRFITASDNGSGGSGGGGGGGTVVTPTPVTVPAAVKSLVEDGVQQVSVTPLTASKDGVTTVTVSDSDLKAALDKAAKAKTAIVISLGSIADKSAELSLTAEQLKLLAGAQAGSTVIVNIAGSAVSLPISLLAASPAGQSLKLVIKQEPDAASKLIAGTPGAKVIGTPVSYEASWTTATGSTYLNVPTNVFIKRSFTVPGKIESKTAGVLFEKDGLVTPVASVFTPQADETTLVTVSRPGFSVYAAVSKPAAAFTDIANSKSAAAIQTLADKLIIQGTSATTFAPQSNLTRAEFTALLTRALGLRTDAAVTFSDVKASDWYAKDVAAASKAGLILGIGNGKFAPTQKVTRQELAVILDRALKLTGTELKAVANPSFTTYTDSAKVAPYAKDSLQALTKAGIFASESAIAFNPTAPATRETAAAALYELLNKTGLIE